MGIRERLEALPLEKLEALAKKARVPPFYDGEALKAERIRGTLCALSLKDLAALEARALVSENNEKKTYFIERLLSKGVPEHGPPRITPPQPPRSAEGLPADPGTFPDPTPLAPPIGPDGPPASPLGQGEPPSGEFSGGDGVGSSGFEGELLIFEGPEAEPSAIPAEKVLLFLLLFLLFLLL